MRLSTRKLLDKSFTGVSFISIIVMAASLLIILLPICIKGIEAYCFKATIEHRRLLVEKFNKGSRNKLTIELAEQKKVLAPVFEMIKAFEKELKNMPRTERYKKKKDYKKLKKELHHLIGPFPGEDIPVLWRDQYGETRYDRAKQVLDKIKYKEYWNYDTPDGVGIKEKSPREIDYKNTALAELFSFLDDNFDKIIRPKFTIYWGFLFDESHDAHFFGGIWPEVLGTFYLTIGAMLFAVPMGIISAVFLTEYARQGILISFLRSSISTLAGVPSIVFGLFGLAFFINTCQISTSKSVLAGSLTLSLLILPTIIRASEEAIKSVPKSYKEAALSLGAGKWHTILTVILPAALPGILTGIVISMGRAAGETAPIIFTAAVSVGKSLKLTDTLSQPTPALPWNIYNLCTEHEAVEEIRHVQFGMVLTLVGMVLFLNIFAIILRARISKKLKG